MKTVAVIGGGAAGLMAAYAASRSGEDRVILYERQARVGRKLLATGNGRCNLTNLNATVSNYHGQNPAFVRPALEALNVHDTLELFGSLGLLTVEGEGGRMYPLSDSANSVLDVLRFAIDAAGVETKAGAPVTAVSRTKKGFMVETEGGKDYADKVIVACGGCAGSKLGGVTDGYTILQSLGHSRTALYPALTQITSDSPYPRSLKGVRAQAAILRGADDGAHRHLDDDVLAALAAAEHGGAVLAVFRHVLALEAEIHQRVHVVVRQQDDAAAVAAVAAVRAAVLNKLLAMEGNRAVAAAAGLRGDFYLIDKHFLFLPLYRQSNGYNAEKSIRGIITFFPCFVKL